MLDIMNNLKIYVNQSVDGYAFTLLPSQIKMVKKIFGESAHPAKQILVDYDLKSGFEKYYKKLEHFILPALIGLENEEDLKKINNIDFIDPYTDKVIDTLKTND
jgi:hypothetical protein